MTLLELMDRMRYLIVGIERLFNSITTVTSSDVGMIESHHVNEDAYIGPISRISSKLRDDEANRFDSRFNDTITWKQAISLMMELRLRGKELAEASEYLEKQYSKSSKLTFGEFLEVYSRYCGLSDIQGIRKYHAKYDMNVYWVPTDSGRWIEVRYLV